jgi:hypothetical protein
MERRGSIALLISALPTMPEDLTRLLPPPPEAADKVGIACLPEGPPQASFRVQLACSEVMLSKIEKAGLGDVFTRLDLKVGVRGGALW